MSKVSVVIPLYNKQEYIRRAMESVLGQTMADFELIVVDDGSTDESVSVVKQFKDKRIVLLRQPNAGVSAARNRGITAASNSLLAFLDADDFWYPCFLDTVVHLREKYPQAGIYGTACQICGVDSIVRPVRYKHIPLEPEDLLLPSYFLAALGAPPLHSSSVCVPRDVFKAVGMFPEGESRGEDLDMWGRIALKYPVAFSWKVGAVHNHNVQGRASNRAVEITVSPFTIRGRQLIRSGAVNITMKKDVMKYITELQRRLLKYSIREGERSLALKILRDSKTEFSAIERIYWYCWCMLPLRMARFLIMLRVLLKKSATG